VLVGSGEKTASITPEIAEKIVARIPDATLEVWEHRGHFGPFEDPDHAAESMLQFGLDTSQR
jgi:pimeloyl-ACP methyl ester carboxylesterase